MLDKELTKKAILKSPSTDEFSKSKCILTVSVGQPNHEEDKLLSAIIAVNKHFSFCTIMVCDSLQRFTMKFSSNVSLAELHIESNNLGDKWIERNLQAIRQLSIPYSISRWDCWISHPHFNSKKTIIDDLYNNDKRFKETIDDTANNFVVRKLDMLGIDKKSAIELSKQYLLEECAVMLIQADDLNGFEIYPSQRNDAMDYVHKKIISVIDGSLMLPVSIKFKNIRPAKVCVAEII